MHVVIDRSANRALYLQIVDALKHQIENGQLVPFTKLPSSRQLAKTLGVNRITVVNAYAELVAEGLIESHVGQGTFISDIPTTLSVEQRTTPKYISDAWRPPTQNLLSNNWKPNQMVREMMRSARPPGSISFASGTAANDFLPVVAFRQALNDVLRRDGVRALQYEDPIGYYPLRQIIANYLQQQAISATANDILITDGCQQALDLVLRVLGREGDAILVENPSYLGLLDIISSHRMIPVGAPTDEQGLVVDKLEPLILRYQPQLMYIVPNFQNPTGVTMPLERRQALLNLAHKYNMPILEDNIHQELYYQAPPPVSLASLDSGATSLVFHASSYSKVLMPGVRLGYLLAPPALQKRISTMKQATDISSSALNQRALHVYLQSGHFEMHLEKVRNAYRVRRDTMLEAAERYLPDTATWQVPEGGLYLWVKLTTYGPGAIDFYTKALDYGVSFAIGSVFFAYQPSPYTIRLNFASCTPEEIKEGMRRLGKAWNELQLSKQDIGGKSVQSTMPIL